MSIAYDARPALVVLAGPAGAGKTTFYEAHLRTTGMRFIDPDALRSEIGIDAARADELARALRAELVSLGESFVLKTSLADVAQHTLAFLQETTARGYTVVLCFIGIESAIMADQRVAMRALAGGRGATSESVSSEHAHALTNLDEALRTLPFVEVFDNSTHDAPHRPIARFEQGRLSFLGLPLPNWFAEGFSELLALPDEYAIENIAVVDGREQHVLRSSDGRHVLTISQPASANRNRPASERVHLALTEGQLEVQPVD